MKLRYLILKFKFRTSKFQETTPLNKDVVDKNFVNDYSSLKGEYHNINMDMAISYVL